MQSCFEEDQGQPFTSLLHCPESISPPEPGYEPMQVETTRLLFAEWRWLTQNLCLYCGTGGHVITACPVHPPQPMVSVLKSTISKMSPPTTIVMLTASNVSIPVHALLDSGSAGNFISGSLCRQLKLPTIYQAQSVTGKPLSRRHIQCSAGSLRIHVGLLHVETLHLLVLEDSTADVILGRLRFVQHNPIISWETVEVLKWGSGCFPLIPRPALHHSEMLSINSTSIESPVEKQSVEIPACYAPLQ